MISILGLVLALQRPADCQLFYHIQLRSDLVLSQAVTVVVTALLNAAQSDTSEWDSYPPLVTVTLQLLYNGMYFICGSLENFNGMFIGSDFFNA